ncbi:MAG: S4 domain-containing protein, partial [Candidatus Bathyarchaeia archaeon]
LNVAKTRREAKLMVSHGEILVDGKIRRSDDFPVGLGDVISIPSIDKNYRVLPSYKGLILHPIEKEEANFKLCRIEDKKILDSGHIQLNLHDGSNIILKTSETDASKEDYKTLDTLKLSLPERQATGSLRIKEKAFVMITGGKNIGKHGKIVEIERAEGKKRRNALVTIEDAQGNRYQTIMNFVFAVGETQPLISLPEGA